MQQKRIVLAVGGNSLITDPKDSTVQAQYRAAEQTALHISHLLQDGHRLAVVHGNGPQVGFILRRSEIAKQELHLVPLDSCVADTQGAVGYNLQMALRNQLRRSSSSREAAAVVTQVLVDPRDPSFTNPQKPVGSYMDRETAETREKTEGWDICEDAGRGYRRVVPSPVPQLIMEIEVIRLLFEQQVIVIAAGGGGIPVTARSDGSIEGKEAVIDKDLTAGLLAEELHADLFMISTAVREASLYFGTPHEKPLGSMTVPEARAYLEEGHFAPGSMKPKIQAMIQFAERTGKPAVLTDPEHLKEASEGNAGTRILPDNIS